ncbi:hypothetical protein [Deinococcus pimensis]|uniref:hypothetical protein n=1 Tax=Deinococcus pimensis TaxID=309888 RepID=UPI001FDF5549|nr:hypothetical protein [Deinococcus pimensis]
MRWARPLHAASAKAGGAPGEARRRGVACGIARRTGRSGLAALLVVLAGCAPAVTRPQAALTAAFSAQGVAWVSGGAVFLARAPLFRPQRVPVPGRATDVAWNGGNAWVALPAAGWVQRITGEPGVVQVGRVVELTDTRAYREDGTAINFRGQDAPGLVGAPDQAVTGGDGLDYAVQAGRLYRVDPARTLLLDSLGAPLLVSTPTGAGLSTVPVAFTADSQYRLQGGTLERVDAAGRVRASVPHGPGVVGVSAEFVVTVSPNGEVRVFRYDLTEVKS